MSCVVVEVDDVGVVEPLISALPIIGLCSESVEVVVMFLRLLEKLLRSIVAFLKFPECLSVDG